MSRVTIEWVGTKKLQKMLETSGKKTAIRKVVRKNTMQLHERALSNERKAYIKGYWTGNTARQTTMSIMGLEGRVTVNTNYINYLENGTRFMAKEPAIKPAFNAQKRIFKTDLEKIVGWQDK
ncbi:phage-related head tail joining protein [Ligilactobacillus ruminis]|uniref:HK97-gp10 family putative phage morphogenesis protein n=1 Tax=Ligilactobacillus ruminis TaxID=1623 RepID=UPI00065870C2|nr:HK97-gp10 family putative phage morphogenesis protein [Ligilactobacillus ruminis]KLA45183.1 phage-related head tail joining protein [Ligilactobacillus ruminis]